MNTEEAASERQKMTKLASTLGRMHRGFLPRYHFWYMGVLRLCVGLAQIASVIWCLVLLIRLGITPKTMHAAFWGAGITTLSLLLFKVLGKVK